MLRFLSIALATLAVQAGASAADDAPLPVPARSLTVYHRFTSTSHSSPFFSVPKGEWVEKGRIDVFPPGEVGEGEAAAYIPSSSAWHEWNVPLRAGEWSGNVGQVGGERYQIAIRDEDTTATELPFISVDPCTLYTSSNGALDEHITLSWTSSPSGSPIFGGAFDYRTSTSLDSVACNTRASASSRNGFKLGALREKEGARGKVTVRVERAVELKAQEPVKAAKAKAEVPVQLDEDGKIIPPPAEKSFIQKYWMYIVPALLVIFVAGGGDEPPKEGGGGGGGK